MFRVGAELHPMKYSATKLPAFMELLGATTDANVWGKWCLMIVVNGVQFLLHRSLCDAPHTPSAAKTKKRNKPNQPTKQLQQQHTMAQETV